MDLGQRINTIRNALMNGREDWIGAVATADRVLSGVIPTHYRECQEKLARKAMPRGRERPSMRSKVRWKL